jgi:hypothetical protein
LTLFLAAAFMAGMSMSIFWSLQDLSLQLTSQIDVFAHSEQKLSQQQHLQGCPELAFSDLVYFCFCLIDWQ